MVGVAAEFPVMLAFLSLSFQTAVGMLRLLALRALVNPPFWCRSFRNRESSFGGLVRLDRVLLLNVFDQAVGNHWAPLVVFCRPWIPLLCLVGHLPKLDSQRLGLF